MSFVRLDAFLFCASNHNWLSNASVRTTRWGHTAVFRNRVLSPSMWRGAKTFDAQSPTRERCRPREIQSRAARDQILDRTFAQELSFYE